MHTHNLASFNQRKFKIVVRAFTLIFLLLALERGASAQSTADGSTPLGLSPGAPAGSYALSGFDNVNLFNGNLNFRLPLLSIKGRGSAGYQITLPIERKWIVETEYLDIPGTTDQYRYYPTDNWWTGLKPGYGPGVLQARHGGSGRFRCGSSLSGFYYVYTKTLTRLTFTASDGTEYELRDQGTSGQPLVRSTGCATSQFNRGRVFATSDGSSATFVSDTDITDRAHLEGMQLVTAVTGYLLLRDGTRYRIAAGRVSWMRDRNGNKTSFTYDSNGRMATVTDSLNRQVTVVYATQFPGSDQIIYSGFGGAPRTLTINYDYLQSSLRADQTLKTDKQLFPELDGSNYTSYNPVVVKSVTLPNNGTNVKEYIFKYNSYGELARVVLPTGGAFEYDYAAGRTDGPASGMVSGGHLRKGVYRRVVERRVYKDGATLESKMTYSRPETTTTDTGFVQFDQYDSRGVLQARTKHYFYGSAAPTLNKEATDYPSWKTGHEYRTEMFGADGATLLRRVNQTFVQRAAVSWWTGVADGEPANDPRVTEILTTLEPATANLVTKQTFGYSQDSHNNQTDIYEYDFGAGAPPTYAKRHTQTDFLAVNSVNGVNYAAPANGSAYNYNDVHLRSLPKETRVYGVNATNGVEALMSRVRYDYDQTALGICPGIVGQCVAYDATGQCSTADPTTYTTRGNNTGITRYADAASEASAITSQVGYDVAGNAVSATDALSRVMQVNYADSFADDVARNTYAFPTGTTSPIPDPSGQRASSTPLTTSRTYDYWSGLVNSATDANGKSTYLRYYDDSGNFDPLDRLRRVDYPDGGWVKYSYNRNQYGDYVNTSSAINPSQSTDSYQYFDGLGRSVRTFAWEGSQWSTTDTQYDALGKVWRASNPYLSGGPGTPINPSGYWTTSAYDALGRVASVTTPDGAQVVTAYSGNEVTVTDQAGKKRKSVTDGLGRLRQVVEAPDNANCQADGAGCATTYEYDVMGNLRKVDQGGQLRYFMYDSLSRLIRAKNPEQGNFASDTDFPALTDATSGTSNNQWSMGYTYDANGNLSKRKDARNTTTTYTYDPLNRVLDIGYSDGVTPGVGMVYDMATNGRGRFAWNWAYLGASAANSHRKIVAYDPMGRPTWQQQYFWINGNWGPQDYSVHRTYDLAGHVTSQTYPSGHTANYPLYDAAGRLKKFNGNLGDGTLRTYATGVNSATNVEEGIQYDEAGRLIQEKFGTQTALYHKQQFNTRGQLSDIRLGLGSDPSSMERGAVTINYGTTANNGDVVFQQNWIPTDQSATNWDIRQTNYAYDSLNRVAGMQEYYGTPGIVAQQWYTYDRWGNRQINAALTTDTLNEKQFEMGEAAATNRLLAPGDMARAKSERGMRYDDAGNLTEDIYSGPTGAGTRTYDAENRMTSAVIGINSNAYYTYDADGRRVRRSTPNGTVWQVYGMEGELVAEYAANAAPSAPQKEYGYRNGELLVTAQPAAAKLSVTSVTASTTNGTDAPALAVDGNEASSWIASGFPTQWIELDLGQARSVRKLRLKVNQYPAGATTHQISGGTTQVSLTPLWTQSATVASGQWLEATFTETNVRYLRVTTQSGPSWVAWFEIEVYGASGGGSSSAGTGEVNWLVSDHLGSPRMIADLSGSLAGIRRHDYLPFGEEAFAGQGGRTVGQGYASDAVRQKFTGYEHDTETNLDYAQARYYASAHGRFTGVDPLLSSATPADPQTWNRYSYVANNPLSNTDPTGMFIVMKSPFDGMSPNDTAGQAAQQQQRATPPPPPPPQTPPQPAAQTNAQCTQQPMPSSVTIMVGQPVLMANVRPPGTTDVYMTGAVSIFSITVQDASGNVMTGGITLQESVEVIEGPGATVREREVVPSDNGVFPDFVGMVATTSAPMGRERAINAVNQTVQTAYKGVAEQTLKIRVPGCGVVLTVVNQRTFSNIDAQGKVRNYTNERGTLKNNYEYRIKAVSGPLKVVPYTPK